MSKLKIYTLDEGISLGLIKTDKFKSNLINLYFLRNIDRDEVTKISLLINLLSVGTKNIPTTRDMSKRLNELYGMGMNINTSKYGEKLCAKFRFFSVSDKYLDKPIFEEVIDFIREVIFNPIVIDKKLNPNMLDVEKENLKEELKSIINDKKLYASSKCIKNMCKEELFSIDSSGYIEDIDKISASDLYETYLDLIATSRIFISVEGNFDEEVVSSIFKEKLTFPRNNVQNIKREEYIKYPESTNYFEEEFNTNQGKLVMGYRTNVDYKDFDSYYSLLVGNSIFGGGPHSKLFNNVREKESICYYVSSELDKYKGIMMVNSGIDIANYDKALLLIRKELEDVKNGNFDELELENAKKNIINSLKMTVDTNIGESEFIYNQFISETNLTIDEISKKVNNVDKDSVISAFIKIIEDTVYFLK